MALGAGPKGGCVAPGPLGATHCNSQPPCGHSLQSKKGLGARVGLGFQGPGRRHGEGPKGVCDLENGYG